MTPSNLVPARRFLPYIAWGVLAFTVLFWRLGATSFWDPDEAHYAETTRELLASSDWLTPYYNGQPFFDKPILFHLLQAVPMALFGATETAARLVPALAALALIGVTWWLGATLISAEVGLVAAFLLTTNTATFALARYAILDTVFTAFLFGGVSCLAVAALAERPRLQYTGYVLLAFATLTKGPIALVLAGLAFILAIVVSSDARRRLLRLRWLLGLLIIMLLSAPWFVYMWYLHGQSFVDGYFLNENLALFGRTPFDARPPWWFYLRILPVAMLPWTGVVIGRLYDDVRAIKQQRRAPDTFEVLLWVWVIAIVGFFSLSQFKLDHYVFPAAPALCLLAARAWAAVRDVDASAAGARWGWRLVGPILVVAGVAAADLIITRFDLPNATLLMPVALVVAGGIATVLAWRKDRFSGVPWVASAALGALYAGLLIWVVPAFDRNKVVPDLARWVARHADGDDRVADYVMNRWSGAFRFYVDRPTIVLQGRDAAALFFDERSKFYCVMRASDYEAFVASGIALRVVHARDGMWVTSGPALWREHNASRKFVVVTHAKHLKR